MGKCHENCCIWLISACVCVHKFTCVSKRVHCCKQSQAFWARLYDVYKVQRLQTTAKDNLPKTFVSTFDLYQLGWGAETQMSLPASNVEQST